MTSNTSSSEPAPQAPARVARAWRFGEVRLDEGSLELTVAGQTVELEHRPLQLLLLLLQHAGEVVTKDEILDAVWPGRVVTEASLTKCVARLRQALNDGEQKLIRTAHGYGYRLAAEVSIETATPVAPSPASPAFEFKPGDGVPHRPSWQLVQRLGSGGYGDIWLGEQPKTHEKRVFKFAADGAQLAALKREITLFRVLYENLGPRRDYARILDWNLEAAPFFIELEWSPEGSLPQWADSIGGIGTVPLAERLRLAIEIAEALAAAHSVGVLHKDLKPSNILVHHDGEKLPHIRLSDFGSGRVLDVGALDRMGITRLGFTRTVAAMDTTSGTPFYLAPELIRGGVPTVQADVFALGVMLYQLVIGDLQQPLAPGWEERVDDELLREDIAAAAAGDPLRRLADAAQLATRLRTLESRREARDRARARKAEAEQARHALELASARRVLWRALALTLLIGLGLSLWLAVTAQQARKRAENSARQAQAVTDFLTNDIIAAANPYIVGRRDVQVRQILDQATPALAQRFKAQPLVLAKLQQAIGSGYAALIDPHKAEPLLLAAEQGLSQQEGDASPDTQLLRRTLLDLYEDEFDLDHMAAVAARMDAAERAAHDPNPGIAYEARAVIAFVPCFRQAPADWLSDCSGTVRPFYEQARRELGPQAPATLRLEMNLGQTLVWPQHMDEAEPLLQEACDGLQRLYGEHHPRLMYCRSYLAYSLDRNGKTEQALPIYQEVTQVISQALGGDTEMALIAKADVATALMHLGRDSEALPIARQVYDSCLRVMGPTDRETLLAGILVARIQTELGQTAPAAAYMEKAVQLGEGGLGEAAPATVEARDLLGTIWRRAGDSDKAVSLLQRNLDLARRHYAGYPLMLARREASLGEALAAQGHTDQARPLLQDARRILETQLGPHNLQTQRVRKALESLPGA